MVMGMGGWGTASAMGNERGLQGLGVEGMEKDRGARKGEAGCQNPTPTSLPPCPLSCFNCLIHLDRLRRHAPLDVLQQGILDVLVHRELELGEDGLGLGGQGAERVVRVAVPEGTGRGRGWDV